MKFEIQKGKRSFEDYLRQKLLRNQQGAGGALGIAGDLAVMAGSVFQSEHPRIARPALALLAADHGISADFRAFRFRSPHQDMLQLLNGHTPLNKVCSENGLQLKVIDCGTRFNFHRTVEYWMAHNSSFLSRKCGPGSANFSNTIAVSTEDVQDAFDKGIELADRFSEEGSNTVGVSVMADTAILSAAALNYHLFTASFEAYLPPPWRHHLLMEKLQRAAKKHPKTHDPITLLSLYGNYDLAMAAGLMLRAAENKMMLILDGWSTLTAAAIAASYNRNAVQYMHIPVLSDHPFLKKYSVDLKSAPYMNWGLHHQGGVSAVQAVPLLRTACSLLNEEWN